MTSTHSSINNLPKAYTAVSQLPVVAVEPDTSRSRVPHAPIATPCPTIAYLLAVFNSEMRIIIIIIIIITWFKHTLCHSL